MKRREMEAQQKGTAVGESNGGAVKGERQDWRPAGQQLEWFLSPGHVANSLEKNSANQGRLET